MAKLTNKEQTQKINQLIQTVVTLHNSLTQLGQFVSEYIEFKGDTASFHTYVEKLIAAEQEKSKKESKDGKQK